MHEKHKADARTETKSGIPEQHLLAIREFVDKVGGVEKAREAIETLGQLRKAA